MITNDTTTVELDGLSPEVDDPGCLTQLFHLDDIDPHTEGYHLLETSAQPVLSVLGLSNIGGHYAN